MKVIVKSPEKWVYPKNWLEALKIEFHRQLPNRKIWMIIENNSKDDYVIKINGATGKITVRVNIGSKSEITTIFKKGYLQAVVEHELKHLQPNINFLIDTIIPPESILETESISYYNELKQEFSSSYQDFLTDIYANSGMTQDGLKKYLEYEIDKLVIWWNDAQNKKWFFRTPLMLFISYIEACYVAIDEKPSKDLLLIANVIHDDETNTVIYNQMLKIYLTMWKSLTSGQIEVDLANETCTLHDLLSANVDHFL